MNKQIIRLRTGKCVSRVVRDIDFMILSDGKEYGRITHKGKELTVERPCESPGEWSVTELEEPSIHSIRLTNERGQSRHAAELDGVTGSLTIFAGGQAIALSAHEAYQLLTWLHDEQRQRLYEATRKPEEEREPTYETSHHWEERRNIERDWVQL